MILLLILVIAAIIFLVATVCGIFKLVKYLKRFAATRGQKAQFHSKIPEHANLDPIFETNHHIDLKLEDPAVNNNNSFVIDDKKLTDFENVASPRLDKDLNNTSSENSVEMQQIGDQYVKSEAELNTPIHS